MITAYYDGMLILSMALMLAYISMWHKHLDVHITLMYVLVPINNLGYALLARAQTLETALAVTKFGYIGGCYMLPIIMLSVMNLCHIRLNRWLRVGIMALSTAVFASTMTIGKTPLFYKSITFERVDGAVILTKVYGPMHTAYYAIIVAYFLMSVGAMAYSYAKKKQVSRKQIWLLFFPVVISMLGFFVGRRVLPRIELIPACYAFALAMYLVIVYRVSLYDITDSAIDSLVETGDTGLISLDFHLNYLGSNGTARAVFPELNSLTVDRPMNRSAMLRDTILVWLEEFRWDESRNEAHFDVADRCYLVKIGYLFDGRRRRGYQLFLTDDTADRQYIQLLDHFNSELKIEVDQKTRHIEEMHDKLILGMATMVESRDNSTGGHIRRTSEGVRLLVEEIRQDPAFQLSETFCRDIVKAAPMHDLGKIAVDDAVLRKPGRFTPEEFEKMKTHAAEGARIVREILKGTDDTDFQRIAENVAHYHHERWDGSGYPEGLKGDEIPLEARIMAIADVYDALVSKRVYKESMSFEKADAIITEGMGKHFDRRLEPYYQRARPRLEAYYAGLES